MATLIQCLKQFFRFLTRDTNLPASATLVVPATEEKCIPHLFEMKHTRLALPECALLDRPPGEILATEEICIPYKVISNLRHAIQTRRWQELLDEHGEDILFYGEVSDLCATIAAMIENRVAFEKRSRDEVRRSKTWTPPYPKDMSWRKSDTNRQHVFFYGDVNKHYAIIVHGPRRGDMRGDLPQEWWSQIPKGLWYIQVFPAEDVTYTTNHTIFCPQKPESIPSSRREGDTMAQ